MFFYASGEDAEVLESSVAKIALVGGDFGYGNFGDILQHRSAIASIRANTTSKTVSVFAADAMPSWNWLSPTRAAYATDVILLASHHPIRVPDGVDVVPVHLMRRFLGVHLYGGGFLNTLWGDYVLDVAAALIGGDPRIGLVVSGQQVEATYALKFIEFLVQHRAGLVGLRDHESVAAVHSSEFTTMFSFDDATEQLQNLRSSCNFNSASNDVLMHFNTSSYSIGGAMELDAVSEIGKELQTLGGLRDVNVTMLQAYRDRRYAVQDTLETIKMLDCLWDVPRYEVVNLPALVLETDAKRIVEVEGRLGVVSSYHTGLFLQLNGIPTWVRATNEYYRQKMALLQTGQTFDEFVAEPRLPDFSTALEARQVWNNAFAKEVARLDDSKGGNVIFPISSDMPSLLSMKGAGPQASSAPPVIEDDQAVGNIGIYAHPELFQLQLHAIRLGEELREATVEIQRLRELAAQPAGEGPLATVTSSVCAEACENEARERVDAYEKLLLKMQQSNSWRVTKPLRFLGRVARRFASR